MYLYDTTANAPIVTVYKYAIIYNISISTYPSARTSSSRRQIYINTANTTPNPATVTNPPALLTSLSPAFVVATAGFELVVFEPVADAAPVISVAVVIIMSVAIVVAVAVELPLPLPVLLALVVDVVMPLPMSVPVLMLPMAVSVPVAAAAISVLELVLVLLFFVLVLEVDVSWDATV